MLPNVTLPAARLVLARDPECYRACDAMCRVPGVANLHEATAIGPQALDGVFPRRLKSLAPVLPEPVRAQFDKAEGTSPALLAALDAGGDPATDDGEPSWSVLAHLVRETRFIQVYRRMFFMARVWSVPIDDEWPALAPTVEKHRYRPFLDLFVLPPQQGRASVGRFAQQADLSDLELSGLDLARGFTDAHSPRVSAIFDIVPQPYG